MKIKSWQIILFGMFLQILFGTLWLTVSFQAKDFGSLIAGIFISTIGIIFILFSMLGIIPLIFLLFNKTKKIGAILSIILGIICLVTKIGAIVGLCLLITGILVLLKRIQ